MKVLVIIAILAYTGSDTTQCTAVDVYTKDTGTLWLVEGCFEEGDTIVIKNERR
jgi:hypothetical protein